MNSYIFSFGHKFDIESFDNILTFADAYPDFFEVCLDNEIQFSMLMQVLELSIPEAICLNSEEFDSVMDISNQWLPEFTEVEFDLFYSKWLEETGRDNNMDEYGQFIFLQGVSSKMNKAPNRFILSVS